MTPDICIYHGPTCVDGFTAAWAIWKRWPNIEFVPAQYGQEPPDVTGKDVLIVDFSYKRDVLLEMAKSARWITILDHHKTAQADLADWAIKPFCAEDGIALGLAAPGNIMAWFDMDKSGARLAWEYASDEPAPMMVLNVEDRDLWRFQMPWTREVNAYLLSCDFAFPAWDGLAHQISDHDLFKPIVIAGAAIMRAQQKDIRQALAGAQRRCVIDGHDVPCANLPYLWASEAGNIMASGEPFAATYHDTKDGKRAFSLRSTDAGEDVSLIAAKFGGGGHRNAAGFSVDLDNSTWEPV